MSRPPLADEALERIFAAIARAVDAGGPDHAATLARLALLLAREIGDVERVAALAAQAITPPGTPTAPPRSPRR